MTLAKYSTTKWYWHIHHDVLLEPVTEPIENLIAFIKAHKPAEQVPIRLRLLKPVRGDLNQVPAYAKWNKVCATWDKASIDWDKAIADLSKARAALQSDPAILALHVKECPNCPWNGRTIFP